MTEHQTQSPRLLHISASPRARQSESLALAATFVEAYSESHEGVVVDHWDLWDGTLPQFGPDAAAAKMAVFAGRQPEDGPAEAWAQAAAAFERFAGYHRLLFSVPMWNAGVPYILKQFIDVVSQPGMVFGFDPVNGYTGLLRGRKAAVIYTSAVYGPDRGPAFGADFQRPFFDDWLRWAGIEDITEITFRPDLVTADADDRSGVRTRRGPRGGQALLAR